MFTGLIESVGKVVEFRHSRLRVATPWRLRLGESVSVDGVCLTVTARRGKTADFDAGPETLRITTLGSLKRGSRVNLERALRVGDRLGGHWVTGHVESTAKIRSLKEHKDAHWISLDIPRSIAPAALNKGSIAIDGISLTIAAKKKTRLDFMIIPHTWTHTTLATKKVGDSVNIETDYLARYTLQKRAAR